MIFWYLSHCHATKYAQVRQSLRCLHMPNGQAQYMDVHEDKELDQTVDL